MEVVFKCFPRSLATVERQTVVIMENTCFQDFYIMAINHGIAEISLIDFSIINDNFTFSAMPLTRQAGRLCGP